MTYTIRPVRANDRSWILNVAVKNMLNDEVKRPDLFNIMQINKVFDKILEDQTGLIVTKDNKQVGVVAGMLSPHFLNPKKKLIFEVIWYVHKDYRETRASYMLMKGYRDLVLEVADEGIFTIQGHTPIKDSSLAKLGFILQEKHYSLRK